jgi:excisionase family DNA binding protein
MAYDSATPPASPHHSASESPRLALTPEEAAEAIGVGRTTIYELLAGGKIASIRVGRRRVVPVRSIEAFLDAPASGRDDPA